MASSQAASEAAQRKRPGGKRRSRRGAVHTMENALAKHVCIDIQRPFSSSLSATKAGQARLPAAAVSPCPSVSFWKRVSLRTRVLESPAHLGKLSVPGFPPPDILISLIWAGRRVDIWICQAPWVILMCNKVWDHCISSQVILRTLPRIPSEGILVTGSTALPLGDPCQ